MRARGACFVLALVGGVFACGRRVVIDPDDVPRHNDPGWVVKRAPTVVRVPPEPPPSDAGIDAAR